MNNQRQFRQLQNMDYRTPRQEQRMQFLQRQQQREQPQYRQQQPYQPMPESAYGQLPAYRPNNVDYGKLLGSMGGQAMGGAAMDAGFQGAPMQNGMQPYPFQQQVDGMGMQQMPFQGNPTGGMVSQEAADAMRGQMTPQELQDLRGAYSEDPMPMPRGGMGETRNGYAFDRNALPGSSGNMGGISNAGYQSQAPNRLQRSQGISGNIARGGYKLNRVKGLLATKPPQV